MTPITTTSTSGVECPRCRRAETTSLAREGDLQRYQCLACHENFTALPVEDSKTQETPQEPTGFAHAQVMVPEPEEAAAGAGKPLGHCPKCGKPYFRLGQRFDAHVAACDGKPFVASRPRRAPAPEAASSVAAAPVPPGTLKAFELSIEALKVQRSVLEAEIQSLNGAIATLEKLTGTCKGLGGGPSVPFGTGSVPGA